MGIVSEKLVKARHFPFEVAEFKLVLRRPRMVEIANWNAEGKLTPFEFALNCVVSWGDLSESDLIRGGNADPMKFDLGIWYEILSDRSDLWKPIAAAIQNKIEAYQLEREADRKNSDAVSKLETAQSTQSGTAT